MSTILSALRHGSLGATFCFPEDLTIERDEDTVAQLVDPERQIGWWVFFFEGLYLDLSSEHADVLRRDIENHARFLFDSAFTTSAIPERTPNLEPRTADPSWSPLVDLQSVAMGGVPALAVVHRLHYEPCLESVMGHLLVPLRTGLLEFRCVSVARLTGYRETALIEKAAQTMNPAQVDALFAGKAKVNFDEAAYDSLFPGHPLSMVRAALRWCQTLEIKITEPADYKAEGEVAIEALCCAFTPPPRFVFVGPAQGGDIGTWYEFDRISFSGTDGIDRFLVLETKERIKASHPATLSKTALTLARRIHVEEGVQDVECRAERGW